MFDTSQFDVIHDVVSDISLYNENTPYDTMALLPVVGAPFVYHQFRSGRSNWPTTVASLGIGFGLTTAAFRIAGRHAGFTASEWALGQGLGALGVRVGGRHYLMSMFARGGSALSWSVPTWVFIVGAYEWHKYWYDNPDQAFQWRHRWMMLGMESQ